MPPPPASGGQFAPPPPPPGGGQFMPPPPPSGGQFAPPQGQFAPPQGQFVQPPVAQGQFGAPGNQPTFGANIPSGPGGAAVAKAMNPMDAGILGAGVLALILSTFAYYVAKLSGNGVSISQSFSAWHGLFGWLSAVLAFIGAAVLAAEIFAPGKVKLPQPARQIVLTLFAVATLCALLAFFIHPGTGVGSGSGTGFSAKVGHGFSYWASLVVLIAGTALSYLRLKATGGSLPWEKSGAGRNPGTPGAPGTGFPS